MLTDKATELLEIRRAGIIMAPIYRLPACHTSRDIGGCLKYNSKTIKPPMDADERR